MQTLEHWGIVQVIWRRGQRKKYFTVESAPWQIVCNILINREQRKVEQTLRISDKNIKEIRVVEDDLPAEVQGTAIFYLERIREL